MHILTNWEEAGTCDILQGHPQYLVLLGFRMIFLVLKGYMISEIF